MGLAQGPQGHGLGMQTMKHRAQLSGGSLSIQNGSDGGTVVCCQVPRTQLAAVKPPEAIEGGKGKFMTQNPGTAAKRSATESAPDVAVTVTIHTPTGIKSIKKRILIVEDHPVMRHGEAELISREPVLL